MEAQGWPKPFRGHINVAEMWQFCLPLVGMMPLQQDNSTITHFVTLHLFWNWLYNGFNQCSKKKNIHIISWRCAAHDLICPTEWRLRLETCCASLRNKKWSSVYSLNTQNASLLRGHWPRTQQAHVHVWDWTDAWNVQMEWTFDVNFLFFTLSHNPPSSICISTCPTPFWVKDGTS